MELDQVETDFRKWLVCSESSKSVEMAKMLKKAIEREGSYKDITIRKDNSGSESEYYLYEKGNLIALKMSRSVFRDILKYLSMHYVVDKKKEEMLKKNTNDNTFTTRIDSRRKGIIINDYEYGSDNILLRLLNNISSVNKINHSFNYSLVSLLFLQIIIIPGNIGISSFGDWGTYSLFIIMFSIWCLDLWTYNKLYQIGNSYNELFKLTGSYYSLIWLFCFLEVILIHTIQGDFNIWFSLLLLFLGQLVGLIISLFSTMLTYFIMGGKVLVVK